MLPLFISSRLRPAITGCLLVSLVCTSQNHAVDRSKCEPCKSDPHKGGTGNAGPPTDGGGEPIPLPEEDDCDEEKNDRDDNADEAGEPSESEPASGSDDGSGGCPSCSDSGSGGQEGGGSKKSPTGFNFYLGMGRDQQGSSMGKLHFPLDANALPLNFNFSGADSLSSLFDVKKGEGLEQAQITKDALARITSITTSYAVMTFAWSSNKVVITTTPTSSGQGMVRPSQFEMEVSTVSSFQVLTITHSAALGGNSLSSTAPTGSGSTVGVGGEAASKTMRIAIKKSPASLDMVIQRWDGSHRFISRVEQVQNGTPLYDGGNIIDATEYEFPAFTTGTRVSKVERVFWVPATPKNNKTPQLMTQEVRFASLLAGDVASSTNMRLQVPTTTTTTPIDFTETGRSSLDYDYLAEVPNSKNVPTTNPNYQRLYTITHSNGSWKAFTYTYPNSGNYNTVVVTELTPYGTAAITPQQAIDNPALCRATVTETSTRDGEQVIVDYEANNPTLPPTYMHAPACTDTIKVERILGRIVSTTTTREDVVPVTAIAPESFWQENPTFGYFADESSKVTPVFVKKHIFHDNLTNKTTESWDIEEAGSNLSQTDPSMLITLNSDGVMVVRRTPDRNANDKIVVKIDAAFEEVGYDVRDFSEIREEWNCTYDQEGHSFSISNRRPFVEIKNVTLHYNGQTSGGFDQIKAYYTTATGRTMNAVSIMSWKKNMGGISITSGGGFSGGGSGVSFGDGQSESYTIIEKDISLPAASPYAEVLCETDSQGRTTKTYTQVGKKRPYKVIEPSGIITTFARSGSTDTTRVTIPEHSRADGTDLPDETLSSSLTLDVQGRVIAETRGGVTRSWTYSDNLRTTTETLPTGLTRITTLAPDGQVAQVTGTAQVAEYHSYSVTPTGLVHEVHYAQANGPRWQSTTTDASGNVLKEEAPAPKSDIGIQATITTNYRYDDLGRLIQKTASRSAPYTRFTPYAYAYAREDTLTRSVTTITEGFDTDNDSQPDALLITKTSGLELSGDRWLEIGENKRGQRTSRVSRDPFTAGTDSTAYAVHKRPDGSILLEIEKLEADLANAAIAQRVTRRYLNVPTASAAASASAVAANLVTTHSRSDADYYTTITESVPRRGTRRVVYDRFQRWAYTLDIDKNSLSSATYIQGTTRMFSYAEGGQNYYYRYDSLGRLIRSESPSGFTRYAYDEHDRLTHQWGTATYPVKYSYNAYGQLETMTTYSSNVSGFDGDSNTPPSAFNQGGDLTSWSYFEATGDLIAKTMPDGSSVRYAYDAQGRLRQRIWARGTTTSYSYDDFGRLISVNYSDGTAPVSYTYNAAGDVASVTDGTGTHTPQYDATTGLQTGVSSGGFTFSQPLSVVPASPIIAAPGVVSRRSFSITPTSSNTAIYSADYDIGLTGLVEAVRSNDPLRVMRFDYKYDTSGRLATLEPYVGATGTTSLPNHTLSRRYDTSGRLNRLYYGPTTLPGTLTSAVIYSGWTYAFDAAGRRSRVSSLGNVPASTLGSSGTNGSTDLRRAGWVYGYGTRSEVISAQRTMPTADNVAADFTATPSNPSPVAQASYQYRYDLIGNRTEAGQGTAPSLVTTTYQAGSAAESDPNTYSTITRPDVVDISGITGTGQMASQSRPKIRLNLPPGASASPNDAMAADRLGETNTYRSRHTLSRGSNPNIPANEGFMALVTVTANSSSSVSNQARSWTYVPPQIETLTYDEDGNLRSDGRWLYTWDGENRLVRMDERALRYNIPPKSATDAAPITAPPPRQRLEFHYDFQHRRSAKRVFTRLDDGRYVLTAHTRFLYDGWNLVAELDALNLNAPIRSYLWGSDLSGSLQGAGGVGGLLLVKHHQAIVNASTGAKTDKSVNYLVHSDANGNVMALRALDGAAGLTAVSGTPYVGLAAAFDYDPFGRRVLNTLSVGQEACPIGFSSKYEDRESGMVYYGYRYYSPELGRWLNRDPIGERGGFNLYGMVRNDPVNRWDLLGLADDVQATPKEAPKECCKKEGVKATNCFIITIWKAKGWGSMAFGHASFGLPGDTRYGFHGDGYLDDDKDMKGYDKENEFECCCLTDKEVEKLKAKIEKVKKKIKDKDKTDLEGNEYSLFNTHDPNPTCSGTAAGFAAGMGCPNVAPTNGTRPYELNDALSKNDFCSKK